MIANDQQLATVLRQLQELKEWRDHVLAESTGTPFQTHIEVAGIEKMIARLQEEKEVYRKAKAGHLPPVVTAHVCDGSFEEVADALVQLRVASGMTQEDLARALGKRQPSIARWEREGYGGYTLKELGRLAAALGRELHISFVAPISSAEAERGIENESPNVPVGIVEK
jgi:DNA-binding XRE family transcriptional regulator